MFAAIQASITEWGLIVAAVLCLVGAAAAFVYIPVFGRPVAAVLVALACGLAAYDLGYQARGSLDNSGAIQAQLDEANRQIAASKMIADASSARETATADVAVKQQGLIDAYETKLAARGKSVGCGLSADDVRSLRNLSGSNPSGPPRRSGDVRPAGSGS